MFEFYVRRFMDLEHNSQPFQLGFAGHYNLDIVKIGTEHTIDMKECGASVFDAVKAGGSFTPKCMYTQ